MQNEYLVISKEQIIEALANVPEKGKRVLEPIKSLAMGAGMPFNILEDKNVSESEAELHKTLNDLFFGLEGEATFIIGGQLVDFWIRKNPDGTLNENELGGKEISGGTEVILRAGDWLWIPAGLPHLHKCLGVARMAVIKIPSKI